MSKLGSIITSAILLATLLLLIPSNLSVRGVGEAFTLSASPGWIAEGNAAGVNMVLSVSNAQFSPPTSYVFNWTITDPSGKLSSVTNTTLSTVSSWSEVANFPKSFAGSIQLVGTYHVNVAEILPAINASVARVQFQTGLTNAAVYNRTTVVSVTGSGYLPSDPVTMSLRVGGQYAPGFPLTKNATAMGIVSFQWPTTPSTPLGIYNVSLTGTNSPAKSPADTQLFTVRPTNVTVNTLVIVPSTHVRTDILEVKFNVSYLNTVMNATTGTAQLQLTEPGGMGSHMVLANFDSSKRAFVADYSTTLTTTIGAWTVSLPQNGFDDGYGNGGPLSTISSSFTLLTASLAVYNQPYTETFSSGNTIAISSKVLTPAGANFTQGLVSATISENSRTITGPLSLNYDQTQGRWTGSYKVGPSDPSGTWLLTVTAQDVYGNSGQTVSSFNVNTPETQPWPTTTWTWLIPILAILGVGFGMLILKLRKGIHREVKLDLQAIHRKAEEVKSDDFLQSIQIQLKRRMDRMNQESQEKKSD